MRLSTLIFLSHFVVVSSPLAGQVQIGDFYYEQQSDPITDDDRSAIYTQSVEQSSLGPRGRLVWRCDGDEDLEMWIAAGEFLNLRGQEVQVEWRVDERDPHSSRWQASARGTAAFAPYDELVLLTAEALSGRQLVFRVRDRRGVRYVRTFVLSSLGTALPRLACSERLHQDIAVVEEEMAREAAAASERRQGFLALLADTLPSSEQGDFEEPEFRYWVGFEGTPFAVHVACEIWQKFPMEQLEFFRSLGAAEEAGYESYTADGTCPDLESGN